MRLLLLSLLLGTMVAEGSVCYGLEIILRGDVRRVHDNHNVPVDASKLPVAEWDTFEFTYVCTEYWVEYLSPWETAWHFDIVDMYGRTFNDRGDGWIEWVPYRLVYGPEFRFSDNERPDRDGLLISSSAKSWGGVSNLNVRLCNDDRCLQVPDYWVAPSFILSGDENWFSGHPDIKQFAYPETKKIGCGNGVSPVAVCLTSVEFRWPEPGDANQDFAFNQLDIVQVQQAGKYKTGRWATWGEGDWNEDGYFDQYDLVAAQQVGNYALTTAAAIVPEPSTNDLVVVLFACLVGVSAAKSIGRVRG